MVKYIITCKNIYENENVWKLGFSYILTEMMNQFISKINGGRRKFIHWSGHDGNIFAFFGYGKVNYSLLPPFGSYIIAELWKSHSNQTNPSFQSNNSINNSINHSINNSINNSINHSINNSVNNSVNNFAKDNYYIRFIYNGKSIVLPRIYNETLIPFEKLLSFLKKNMPDPEKDCGFIKSNFDKSTLFLDDRE